MSRPEPTRLALPTALACFLLPIACDQVETPSALGATQSARRPAVSQAAPSRTMAPSAVNQPLAAAASASSARPPEEPSVAVERVLVLGDSISDERVGGGGFVKILRERCAPATFDNRAKGGFMLNQMRKRLELEVLPEGGHYSHAIVFGGVNDLYSDQTAKRTLPKIEADLSAIYAALTTRGTVVIAITVTPWGGFKRWFTSERGKSTLALNTWIVAQSQSHAIGSVVDAYPLLSCGDPERLCPELSAPFKDGLHFGKPGQQKLAEALLAGPFSVCTK